MVKRIITIRRKRKNRNQMKVNQIKFNNKVNNIPNHLGESRNQNILKANLDRNYLKVNPNHLKVNLNHLKVNLNHLQVSQDHL